MKYQCISVLEAKDIINEHQPSIVDVRNAADYESGHIDGAIHLDNSTLFDRLNQLDRSKPLIIYCYHGNSSKEAADLFSQYGFTDVYSMNGGYHAWCNNAS